MASVFDKILTQGVRGGQIPARTQRARDWFRSMASEQRPSAASPSKILREYKNKVTAPQVGSMYHFKYDPKLKQTLPYYDTFPLIFMVGPAPGGFYGINLHYLPPSSRARLMDALYETVNNTRFDQTTKLQVSYEILKKASRFRLFKPTFKHYLAQHVKSRFVEVQPSDWDIALFLPTEKFKKADTNTVWSNA